MHIFIISWGTHHDNALYIAEQLKQTSSKISIVYSDINPELRLQTFCNLIQRPNHLYFGDKFQACLNAFQEDLMFIIHADCNCDDWHHIVMTAQSTMFSSPNIGIWAPKIEFSQVNIQSASLFTIYSSPLTVVTQTDLIVACFAKSVVERLKQANYEKNIYGWGIDAMAAAFAYSHNMCAVIDSSMHVKHPSSRAYDDEAAKIQGNEFLKQLNLLEVVQNQMLWAHMRYLNAIGQQKNKKH